MSILKQAFGRRGFLQLGAGAAASLSTSPAKTMTSVTGVNRVDYGPDIESDDGWTDPTVNIPESVFEIINDAEFDRECERVKVEMQYTCSCPHKSWAAWAKRQYEVDNNLRTRRKIHNMHKVRIDKPAMVPQFMWDAYCSGNWSMNDKDDTDVPF